MSRRAPASCITRLLVPLLGLGLLVAVQGSLAAQTISVTGPGVLDQDGATYVLRQDVSATGTAFTINANHIILDLGGHTITYNTAVGDGVYGVFEQWNKTGTRVTNGIIVQGVGKWLQIPRRLLSRDKRHRGRPPDYHLPR